MARVARQPSSRSTRSRGCARRTRAPLLPDVDHVDGQTWVSPVVPVRLTITVVLAANVTFLVAIPVALGVSFVDPTWAVIENLAMVIPTLACFGYAFFRGPRRAAAICSDSPCSRRERAT